MRVVRATGGRQHVVHTEEPGGTLGEVPLFSGGRYPATAVAAADPQVAFALLDRLAGRGRLEVMDAALLRGEEEEP